MLLDREVDFVLGLRKSQLRAYALGKLQELRALHVEMETKLKAFEYELITSRARYDEAVEKMEQTYAKNDARIDSLLGLNRTVHKPSSTEPDEPRRLRNSPRSWPSVKAKFEADQKEAYWKKVGAELEAEVESRVDTRNEKQAK